MPPLSFSKRWRNARLELRRRIAARLISDRAYVLRMYRKEFGRLPNLEHPSGFNEKILVKILGDRRPFLTFFADKLRVREFVRRVAPGLALPGLYWWSERADALALESLPETFILKPNHGSGWLRIVADKRTAHREDLVRLARTWLASDFTIVGREWAYRDIRRAVYAEELLRARNGGSPPDYKLFVFGGKVRLVQVDRDRFSRHTQVLYDRQWNAIEGTIRAARGTPLSAPASLPAMIAAAEALSMEVDFLRVDLYDIDGKPYFGELTHYPNKGLSHFEPASLDELLGSYLQLDDYSRDTVSERVSPAAAGP